VGVAERPDGNLPEGAEPPARWPCPLPVPMARRRVLLYLKPFDVYPPRPLSGASSLTFPPPPPPPRAANPKVRTSLAHPLRFEKPWLRRRSRLSMLRWGFPVDSQVPVLRRPVRIKWWWSGVHLGVQKS
uniref:Uncharacterized protein n=2 Tax=Aegilops tauschii subsp. strangulata TaxID=200361 RepID=A0A453KMW0_AEGTS